MGCPRLTYKNENFLRVAYSKKKETASKIALDYFSFGMPMPNRQIIGGEPYRYAYQGQEKDPETGKEAFQLRLWDSRIGRWLTTDPYGQFSSPYLGMGNNPMNGIDPDGGYKTWFGAALAWIGGGFKGSINSSDNAKTPWHKYSIVTRNDDNIRFDFGLNGGGAKELTDNGYRINSGTFEFPREGVMREKVNTWREDWKESDNNTLASVAYGVIDPPYTFFANFSLISPYPHDLSGKPLTRGSSEHLDASVDGLISLTPLMRVRAAKLNGGQFIKKVNSIPKIGKEIIKRPELRGKLNRAFNWFSSNIGTGIAPNAGTVNSNAKKAHDIIHN